MEVEDWIDYSKDIAHVLRSMASVMQVPQSLRSIAHYVKIGAENADRDPIVHYWCKFNTFLRSWMRTSLQR